MKSNWLQKIIAGLETLCRLIFIDIYRFRTGKGPSMNVAFHPTLRSYAVRKSELYYFETFTIRKRIGNISEPNIVFKARHLLLLLTDDICSKRSKLL